MTAVKIVWGPPASGKTTYVNERKISTDLIYDFDTLMEDLSGRDLYDHNESLIAYLVDFRQSVIERLGAETAIGTAWLIASFPSEALRQQLDSLNAEYILMETPQEECRRRILADERRKDKAEWLGVLDDWFAQYETWLADNAQEAAAGQKDLKGGAWRTMPRQSDDQMEAPELKSRRSSADREIRYVPIRELRVMTNPDTGRRTIKGHAVVYDRQSVPLWFFVERVERGALTKTLASNPDVRALWNHDPSTVLGRTRSGTLRLAEDETGLAIEIDPPSWAAGHMETIERGDVDQMSFGFRVPPGGDRWEGDMDNPIRVLTEIDLHDGDVSPVTYPAYPQTDVSVRSAAMRQALVLPPPPGREPGLAVELLEQELDLEASL